MMTKTIFKHFYTSFDWIHNDEFGVFGSYTIDEPSKLTDNFKCKLCKRKPLKNDVFIGQMVEFDGWHVTHKDCMLDLINSSPTGILEGIRKDLANGEFLGMKVEMK